jgi:hypothetical protein
MADQRQRSETMKNSCSEYCEDPSATFSFRILLMFGDNRLNKLTGTRVYSTEDS